MINPVTPPAPHVVAAAFEGEITKEDIQEVIGLIESGLETSPRISLFFDLSALQGMTATAFLNDLAYALKSLGRLYRFQQVAVVTDSSKLEKLIAWEDWLFKNVELRSFTSADRDTALAWIERKLEIPEPGFSVQKKETHLAFLFGPEISGYDITRVAELIKERYEESGPVRMLAVVDQTPKFGPGFIYEKLRRFNLISLIARYAVVGPESLKSKISAVRPLFNTQMKYFAPGQMEAAEAWLNDNSPTVEVIPTGREDRFALRLSGRITSAEVEAFYAELLPLLKEDNGLDVVLEMPYEEGITLKALFKAMKLGIQHYGKVSQGVRRMALITDSRFLSKATEVENLLTAVEERPFTFAQREIALAWLDEGREEPPALTTQLPDEQDQAALPEADKTKLLADAE
jgi:SpoIIAA-like